MLLTCLVLGAILVSASEFILARQLAAVAQAQTSDNQARDHYTQSETEKREIQNFQPKYVQLVASGFVGSERRLDWVENIQSIQTNRELMPISYEISPQQVFQVDPSIDMGSLELHGSKVLVKMNLLHEMGLLNFLEDMRARQLYGAHDCQIKRLSTSASDKLAAHLYAECNLYWITLGKSAGAEGQDPNLAHPTGQ